MKIIGKVTCEMVDEIDNNIIKLIHINHNIDLIEKRKEVFDEFNDTGFIPEVIVRLSQQQLNKIYNELWKLWKEYINI